MYGISRKKAGIRVEVFFPTTPTVACTASPFVPYLSAGGRRRSLATSTVRDDFVKTYNVTARAFLVLMEVSAFPPDDWLTNEIFMFNVKINKNTFPRENGKRVRATFDNILCLTTSLPEDNPLTFHVYGANILFPRLLLRSLPPSCKGKNVATAFARRCTMFSNERLRSCSVRLTTRKSRE